MSARDNKKRRSPKAYPDGLPRCCGCGMAVIPGSHCATCGRLAPVRAGKTTANESTTQ